MMGYKQSHCRNEKQANLNLPEMGLHAFSSTCAERHRDIDTAWVSKLPHAYYQRAVMCKTKRLSDAHSDLQTYGAVQ